MSDLVLPAFELDCRDWIVVAAEEAGLPEECDGAPVLAVLSSVLIRDGDLVEVSAVLTVGLLDDDLDLIPLRRVAPGAVARELVLEGVPTEASRYVMPAPGHRLAVLAEFDTTDEPELLMRIEQLMRSFRWRA